MNKQEYQPDTKKRIRSINWDEIEKQLLRNILVDYAKIIENKSLNTNANKEKTKAWEEVYKKFNELNCRHRPLSNIQIQWKSMKINARKTHSNFKKEATKTGGGPPPPSLGDDVVEMKDLLNPAELLIDHNIYDSDGHNTIQEIIIHDTNTDVMSQDSDIMVIEPIKDMDVALSPQIQPQPSTSFDVKNLHQSTQSMSHTTILNTPRREINENQMKARKLKGCKTKCVPNNISKDHDYINSMLHHSKFLKDDEHKRRMQMLEEEHEIKMQIHKEKLKCIQIERESLEMKKEHDRKLMALEMENKLHT